mmetsp:Transcript_63388/g.176360  ORF Transcript_63388/g.176360 Transcript_63388/m.176360 type:complete len:274 (-) Transcript_63388:402-1223(-)
MGQAMGVRASAGCALVGLFAAAAFVPGAPGPTDGGRIASLRGAESGQITFEGFQSEGGRIGAAPWCAGLFGATAAAVSVRRAPVAVRRERATCHAGAVEAVEAPPPPPPFSPASQIGVTEPLGYFDPLGFCKVGDEAGFRNLRCAELKHGRVAMLASVGTCFQHFVKLPGFQEAPAGLGAVWSPAGTLGFFALVGVSGLLETVWWKQDPTKEPGNFGDPAGWAGTGLGGAGSYSDEMRCKELNNGRAAMFATLGIVVAELATGKDGIQQFGLP